jgi:hypothetical protein
MAVTDCVVDDNRYWRQLGRWCYYDTGRAAALARLFADSRRGRHHLSVVSWRAAKRVLIVCSAARSVPSGFDIVDWCW